MWDRHRVEGYGYYSVSIEPGCYEATVSTWRPIGSTVEEMTNFFVGGTGALRDMKDCGVPMDFTGRFLNRYGSHCEASGDVHIEVQTMVTTHVEQASSSESVAVDSLADAVRAVVARARAARDAPSLKLSDGVARKWTGARDNLAKMLASKKKKKR
jgi:hypothetical protein